MLSLLRRLKTLPPLAILVIVVLAVLVPIDAGLQYGMQAWAHGGTLDPLIAPFFWTLHAGRAGGGVMLAILLLYARRPAAVAIVITAVCLAGPLLGFFWRGVELLAASGGRISWTDRSSEWLLRDLAVPVLVTAALLIPRNVRRAYGIA